MNPLNKINCKDLGVLVILTFFTLIWLIYNSLIRPSDPNKSYLFGKCFINIPKSLQILFPHMSKKEGLKISYEECLNVWSLGHVATYFTAGLIVPERYLTVIIISLLCEIYEYFAGYRARLSDIFVNFLSYFIASQIRVKALHKYGDIMCQYKNISYLCIPIALILLTLLVTFKESHWT